MSALDPHPRSPSVSTTSAADADLSSEYDIDFSSSDDEAGVFFGTPKAVESKISAALSRNGAQATPLLRDRIATFKPRRSSLANRVIRRDSREFVHRKSMLSTPNAAGPSGEKVWEGGFHERTPEDISPVDLSRQDAEQDVAGLSTPTAPPADVTMSIDNLRLDTFPSSSDSDDTPNDGAFDFDEEEEDKENSAVSEEWYGEEGEEGEEEYIPAPPESVPLTIGFRADQFEHDHSQQLDMGNLSILDIDDPEEVPLELGNDTSGGAFLHSLGSSTSSSIASYDSIGSLSRQCALRPPTPPSAAQATPLKSDSEQEGEDHEVSREDDHQGNVGEPQNNDHDASEAVVSPPSEPIAMEHTVAESTPLTTTPKAVAGDAETPDVPLADDIEATEPAGESAATGSAAVTRTAEPEDSPHPVRRRETMDLLAAFRSVAASSSAAAGTTPTFLDDTVDMIEFTPLKPDGEPNDGDASFVSDMDSPMARAPVMIPVFSVQSPPRRSTPIRATEPMLIDDLTAFEPGVDSSVDLPNLDDPFGFRLSPFATAPATTPNKSKLPVLSSVKQTPAETAKAQRVLARSQAAKDQLNELFSSRIGKPARVESASSTSAAKPLSRSTQHQPPPSTSRVPSKQVVKLSEESLKAPEAVKPKGKAAAPVKGILKTSKPTQPKPFALSTSQRPVAKPSALPRPTSSVPTSSGLPRPALKRPAAATASQAGPSKLFRMAPKVASRPGEAAHPLKRPAFSVSSYSARPAVPAAGSSRATLGMPSRPLKDVDSTSSLLSSNGKASALSNPPLKSPGKGLSPAKPVLGKPYRPPTGMTPTASRTMPTPQRGFPTPSKSFKLGTPSRPATTPQKQRSRMMAALSEERPRGTPIRAEAPPSPPKWINTRMDVELPVKAETNVEPPPSDAVAEARVLAPTPSSESETSATSVTSVRGVGLSPDAEKGKKSSQETSDDNNSSPEQAKEATPPPQSTSEKEQSPDPLAGSPKEEGEEPAQPESQQPSRRSSRARTPRQSHPSPPKKPKAAPAESIVPGMTESALKSATTRNTKRNQVYLCTIDRHIVRVPGQRPPSPDAGMRRASERQIEEQNAGRDARAKRRARSSLSEEEDADDEGPAVERGVLARKAPGDLEEFTTPVRVRPAKRVKHGSGSGSEEGSEGGEGGSKGSEGSRGREAENGNGEGGKRVRWDEGLLIIRRGLGKVKHERHAPTTKSCVTPKARYPLDEHGNAVDRPTERLKRTTIRVNAVFYEGEEPVHFEYNQPANGKKKGKK